ncbi:MAG: prephenate dehydratase [Chloroflexi bacterium]|nr:prephenate dehydratase [Chloroflexota bacterium]
MQKRLGFLGPVGTFTEEAALSYDPKAKLIPFSSIPAVGASVATGMTDEGVVPIENSIEGSVPDTLDLLINEPVLAIRRELVLPIEHCLLVKPGTQSNEIKLIYSHPQALGQCRRFLERCFPKAQAVASLSTAAAAEEMLASSTPAAAIATRRAASIYGAEILATRIQDRANNVTRFVVLSQADHPRTGADKTSLCFSFSDDRPGLLWSALGEFAKRNINLAKVESRPTKESLGEYIFLVDLEGHREDKLIQEALDGIRKSIAVLRIFGSYPRYTGMPVARGSHPDTA